MGLMLCVRFKLDVVTVVLHKDSALWKRSGEHPVTSARGDFQPSVCSFFINKQLHADMAGSSTTVHTLQYFMWSQFHDCLATLIKYNFSQIVICHKGGFFHLKLLAISSLRAGCAGILRLWSTTDRPLALKQAGVAIVIQKAFFFKVTLCSDLGNFVASECIS